MDETEKSPKPVCTNCGKEMTRKGEFCQHCGQKKFDGRIRMSELFSKFLHNITHLDGQFVRMMWQLLVPGKVTTEYFKGRIKSYPHPVQFFFVVMFFFLLIIHQIQQDGNEGMKITVNEDNGQQRVISSSKLIKDYAGTIELLTQYENLPDTLKSPGAKRVIDTLSRKIAIGWDKALGYNPEDNSFLLDSMPVFYPGGSPRVSIIDIVKMPQDQLEQTYHVNGYLNRMFFQQAIKTMRDSKDLASSIISNLTWTILVTIGIMSCFLWLIFRRKRSYFVEHFIFLLHFFSGLFLLLTFVFSFDFYLYKIPTPFWVILVLTLETGFFMAIRQFYSISGLKSVGVWFFYNIVQIIVAPLIFIGSMFIAFLLF